LSGYTSLDSFGMVKVPYLFVDAGYRYYTV
jgi:hypothetical protein